MLRTLFVDLPLGSQTLDQTYNVNDFVNLYLGSRSRFFLGDGCRFCGDLEDDFLGELAGEFLSFVGVELLFRDMLCSFALFCWYDHGRELSTCFFVCFNVCMCL
jgi:hypothetical protein